MKSIDHGGIMELRSWRNYGINLCLRSWNCNHQSSWGLHIATRTSEYWFDQGAIYISHGDSTIIRIVNKHDGNPRGLHLVNLSHSTCNRGILKNTLNFYRYWSKLLLLKPPPNTLNLPTTPFYTLILINPPKPLIPPNTCNILALFLRN